MPFTSRKSIKAGPFRFNLSKSGVGVSVGLGGLRIGSGPRGNYISLNGARFQYKELTTPELKPPKTPEPKTFAEHTLPTPSSTHGELEEIDSGSVLNMVDTTASDLLQSMNSTYTKPFVWPAAAAAFIFATFLSYVLGTPPPAVWTIATVGGVGTLAVYLWDEQRRLIVLFYDLDDSTTQRFESLVNSFDELSEAKCKWHIASKGDVYDRKYHAGAGSIVDRKTVAFSGTPPASIRTNITVPTIPVGRQFLCFFPDRLFVFDRKKVGAVSYSDLSIDVDDVTFVEDEAPPRDSEQVGRTWQYVNKNGSPDKRFKNNAELPIMAYQAIQFASLTGLNERIQVSLVGPAHKFSKQARNMADHA